MVFQTTLFNIIYRDDDTPITWFNIHIIKLLPTFHWISLLKFIYKEIKSITAFAMLWEDKMAARHKATECI